MMAAKAKANMDRKAAAEDQQAQAELGDDDVEPKAADAEEGEEEKDGEVEDQTVEPEV